MKYFGVLALQALLVAAPAGCVATAPKVAEIPQTTPSATSPVIVVPSNGSSKENSAQAAPKPATSTVVVKKEIAAAAPPEPPIDMPSSVERLPSAERLPATKTHPSVVVEGTIVLKPTIVVVRPSGEQTKTVVYLKNLRACLDGKVDICNLATLSLEDYKRVRAAAAARTAVAADGAGKSICVDGYFRKNGTFVRGYCRGAKTN